MAFLAEPTSVVQKFSPHIGKEHFCLFPLKSYRSVFLMLVSELFRQEASFYTSGPGMMEKDNSCKKIKPPNNSCVFLTESCSSRPASLNINCVTESVVQTQRGEYIHSRKTTCCYSQVLGISTTTWHCPET